MGFVRHLFRALRFWLWIPFIVLRDTTAFADINRHDNLPIAYHQAFDLFVKQVFKQIFSKQNALCGEVPER